MSDPTSEVICVPITSGTRIANNPTSVGPVDFRVQFWQTHSFVTSNRRTCPADVNCIPSVAELGGDITPTVVGPIVVVPTDVVPVAGKRVKLPPLAMLTGIADTVVVDGNNCGADDHDCPGIAVGELQALLGGAPTGVLTFTQLAPDPALELEKLAKFAGVPTLEELTTLGVAGLCCDCDAKYGTPTEAPNSEAIITGREAIVFHLSP